MCPVCLCNTAGRVGVEAYVWLEMVSTSIVEVPEFGVILFYLCLYGFFQRQRNNAMEGYKYTYQMNTRGTCDIIITVQKLKTIDGVCFKLWISGLKSSNSPVFSKSTLYGWYNRFSPAPLSICQGSRWMIEVQGWLLETRRMLRCEKFQMKFY